MRLKIILPTAIVVLLVGLLSFVVVRQKLTVAEDPVAAKVGVARSALGAAGVLQLQLLRAERWLAEPGRVDVLRDRLQNVSFDDRGARERGTEALDALKRQAGDAPSVFAIKPDIAALVDREGKAHGRSDDPQTYQGDDFGAEYPALLAALRDNRTGSDLWLSTRFTHKYLVSYAPVRDKGGKPLGAVVFGWTLSDANVAGLADGATVLAVPEGDSIKVKARANEYSAPGFAEAIEGPLKEAVTRALRNGADTQSPNEGQIAAIVALRNVGDGAHAAIAVARHTVLVEHPDQIAWPILAATGLGLVFIFIAGSLLGTYITEPVGKMEEGLLQVINGNTNQRMEIEHAELGGLAYRINQLLNTFLGVEEDNTDEEGRPSAPPEPEHFQEALSVDDIRVAEPTNAALASEPEDAYYARIYAEYIQAKRENGEATDGITLEVFTARIRGMEREASAKYGRPVRYAVQRRDKQVVLLAVPIE